VPSKKPWRWGAPTQVAARRTTAAAADATHAAAATSGSTRRRHCSRASPIAPRYDDDRGILVTCRTCQLLGKEGTNSPRATSTKRVAQANATRGQRAHTSIHAPHYCHRCRRRQRTHRRNILSLLNPEIR